MSRSKLKQVLSEFAWQVGPPLTYGVLMLRFFPYWRDFWISSDEGYNLMKAMMVVKGYTLYNQIWSDQPPLLTYLLAWMFHLKGYSVYSSRLLILAFSCVMVWSVVQFLRLVSSKTSAVFGILLFNLGSLFSRPQCGRNGWPAITCNGKCILAIFSGLAAQAATDIPGVICAGIQPLDFEQAIYRPPGSCLCDWAGNRRIRRQPER